MTEQEILGELTTIFRDLFDDDALTLSADTTAKDVPGWDSMKMINIVVAVEDHFGVSFTTREVDKLETIRDLVGLVHAKQS